MCLKRVSHGMKFQPAPGHVRTLLFLIPVIFDDAGLEEHAIGLVFRLDVDTRFILSQPHVSALLNPQRMAGTMFI